MKVIESPGEAQAFIRESKSNLNLKARSIGFVPTM